MRPQPPKCWANARTLTPAPEEICTKFAPFPANIMKPQVARDKRIGGHRFVCLAMLSWNSLKQFIGQKK